MKGLDAILRELLENLPAITSDEAGISLVPVDLFLDLPLEIKQDGHGHFLAVLPSSRLATGFEVPLSRLTARFATEES